MAQSRSSQRGVVRVAGGALLAAMGSLLSVTGCASADDLAQGSGGSERLGSVQQAVAFCPVPPSSKVACAPDTECATTVCSPLAPYCVPAPLNEGKPCGPREAPGVCMGTECCAGCYIKLPEGGVACGDGISPGECGPPGEECVNCDRGDTCMVYGCEPERRSCTEEPIKDDQPCTDDSGRCWQGACCTGCINKDNECAPGNKPAECGLSTVDKLVECQSCDDGNVCSNDPCTNGVCAVKTPKPGSCNDSNACTSSDTCSGTTCGGSPVTCNDNKACTTDTCDMMTGCKFTPLEAGKSCDDGNVCNGESVCDGGTECKPGTPRDCDDANPCTTDSCDALEGCKNVNNNNPCSDNNLCTIGDQCGGGSCQPGAGTPVIDDNNPCTTDTCSPASGPVHTPKPNGDPCDDGNACTTTDECAAGKCLGSGGPTCDDNDPCTKNTCSVATQACSNPDENNGTPCVFDKCHVNSTCQAGSCSEGDLVTCDDSNPCTDDSCDPVTGCKFVANTADCSDDNQCTTADKCSGGDCVGTPKVCVALDDCHEAGECDPEDGACDDPRADDGIACQDSNELDGFCADGICQPPSEGGAGGEPGAGGVGPGAGGSPVVGEGGEPATVPGMGGEGNEPSGAGMPGEMGGSGGSSSGGTTSHEGGAPEVPEHVFVRQPGGCSCSVPGSENQSGSAAWLAGLALAAALSRRSRGRRRAA